MMRGERRADLIGGEELAIRRAVIQDGSSPPGTRRLRRRLGQTAPEAFLSCYSVVVDSEVTAEQTDGSDPWAHRWTRLLEQGYYRPAGEIVEAEGDAELGQSATATDAAGAGYSKR